MVRVADDGVFVVDAGSDLAVVVSEEVVVAVQILDTDPLDMAILEEHMVKPVGMIAALLAAVVRGVSHHGMVRPPAVPAHRDRRPAA